MFQECGTPHPVQSRNRRAPAPREEASRSWRASAEEERPTTAAGTNLHRLVSSGAAGAGGCGKTAAQKRGSFVFCRSGLGAPGETEPSAGLLGWTACNGVRGLPHGSRSLTGGGTLLDWSWERPVSVGLWRLWESGRREGCSRSSRGAVLSGICRLWSWAP